MKAQIKFSLQLEAVTPTTITADEVNEPVNP